MTIQETKEGGVVTLAIEGRVDTTNAKELETGVTNAFAKAKDEIIDL